MKRASETVAAKEPKKAKLKAKDDKAEDEKKAKKGKENKTGKDKKTAGKKDALKAKIAKKHEDKKGDAAAAKKGQKKGAAKGEPAPKDKKGQRELQKKKRDERKAKDNNVFELGVKAKQLWEKVRSHETSKEEKEKLIPELHSQLKGQILKVIHAHDTVRVIEFLMAEGGPEVRQQLFVELKDELIGLAKSKYATFFVQKLLRYGTKEQKDHIIKAFSGKVAQLTKHKVANAVIETAYNDFANAPQRNALLQEFFGPEFRLWKQEDLRTVLDVVNKHPEKEKGITLALGEHANVLIIKGCYNQSLVHTVIYNYIQLLNRQITRKQEVIEADASKMDFKSRAEKSRSYLITLLRDACVHILHSHDGPRAAMNALWHGNAKDRKSIVKSFKTFIAKICGEEQGHMVLLAAFDCVDDTKLMGKAVVGEMIEHLDDVLASESGRKVVMYLVTGRNTTFFHPDYLAVLSQGDGNEFTKKEESVRRKELAASVQQPLLAHLATKLEALLEPSDKFGNIVKFVQAVLNSNLVDESVKPAHLALAEYAARPFKAGLNSIMEQPQFNQLMKKLISHDKERTQGFTFSRCLLDEIKKQGSMESMLSCNRSAFVLVFMLEAEIEDVKQELTALLKESANQSLIKNNKCKGNEILAKKIA